mmetsp:Transcript_70578/g.178875  ORF Transcript_70578/g.178875 Transcript_70578/m.178875 type:complete len:326 (+) Transcript_70578:109-1086(+)
MLAVLERLTVCLLHGCHALTWFEGCFLGGGSFSVLILDALDSHTQRLEGLLDRVRKDELVCVGLGDHAVVHEGLPIDDSVPELLTDEDHRELSLDLPRLHEGDDFEELVAGAEAAGRDDEAHALVGHPELAREEVVELEAQLRGHPGVQPILEGQGDAEADRLPTGLVCALVGGLHHARASASAHNVLRLVLSLSRLGPSRQLFGKLGRDLEHGHEERLLIEPLQRSRCDLVAGVLGGQSFGLLDGFLVLGLRLGPGGAEEHHDIVDARGLEPLLRLLHLAHNADEASIVRVEEAAAAVGLRRLRAQRHHAIVRTGHDGGCGGRT